MLNSKSFQWISECAHCAERPVLWCNDACKCLWQNYKLRQKAIDRFLTFCQTSASVPSTLLDLEVIWRIKNLKDCPNIWDKSSRWMTEQYWKRWQLWPDLYFTEWHPWRDTTYLLVTRHVNVKYPDVKMQLKAAPLIRANVCDRVTSWERGGLKHCRMF